MSNVHAAERKENVIFATLHHAVKLRREIRALCLRDFSYKFREKKGETEIQIERRKKFERAELDKEVDCVVDILRSITSHITLANKINPETWPEYTERRLHQTLAIAECGRLSAEIQFAIEDFATDVNQFIPNLRITIFTGFIPQFHDIFSCSFYFFLYRNGIEDGCVADQCHDPRSHLCLDDGKL